MIPLPLLPSTSASGCGSCSSRHTAARPASEAPMAAEIREIVRRAAAPSAPPVELSGHPTRIDLDLDRPLPLVEVLHHEEVGDDHLWVGVEEAALAVLDGPQNALMTRLVAGETPRQLLAGDGWDAVSGVIGAVGAAGLVQGLIGYRHKPDLQIGRFSRAHLTRSCQLECAHCYADSSPHVDRTGELPTARWRTFIEDFAAQGGEQILFTGGEALLHPGCIELLGHAHEQGLHVTLFSNGLTIPRVADAIHPVVDQVQISVDGPDAASHEAIRGRNTFRHVLRALDALAARGTPTRVGMTVVPSTWANWVEKFEAFRARYDGDPCVTYKLSYGVMDYGRGVEIDKTEVASRAEVDAFLTEVNGDMSGQIIRHSSGCGYAEQIVVGPDGTIHPCHLLDGAVCHIDDMPLTRIVGLLGGVVREVDVDHVEGCRSCELRYLCGGSCRVLAGKATGSRLITSCTPAKKHQKYQNLASNFRTPAPS